HHDDRQECGDSKGPHYPVETKGGVDYVDIDKEHSAAAYCRFGLDTEAVGEAFGQHTENKPKEARMQYRCGIVMHKKRGNEQAEHAHRYLYRLYPTPAA